jgi:hypothetical protein
VLLFINVAKFERSGQLLVACWNVDQHHPLTPSSAEEGKSKFPSFLRLVFTHILGWTQGAEVRNLTLSLGERVASVASQVRGYLVMSAHLIAPRRASDPSPGPRRLVKAPVAVDPLPLGEGKDPIPSLCPRERGRRQRWHRCVQREMWDTVSLPSF